VSVDGEQSRLVDVRVGSATDGRAPVSVVERSLTARPFHWAALASISVAAVVADQVTKHLVASRLTLGEAIELPGPITIHYVRNSGIAFGFLQGAASIVTILTGIAVVWMIVYFARSGARHPVLPAAIGFLLGGAVSNLADRIRLGYVVDFLDPERWPAFNLADTFITVGVVILLLALVLAERRPRMRRVTRAR
jgi:signal peptidase II